MPTIRLQKIIAQAGVASRREAERLIAQGLVSVNGKVVTEPGTKADPSAPDPLPAQEQQDENVGPWTRAQRWTRRSRRRPRGDLFPFIEFHFNGYNFGLKS